MKFLYKLGFVFLIFLSIVIYDYQSFDLKQRQAQLEFMYERSHINPNFNFKSEEYKEFIYDK